MSLGSAPHRPFTFAVLVAALLLLSACARLPPNRSSPELVQLPGTPAPLAVDRLNDELVWVDEARQTVLARRSGEDVALQAITIPREDLFSGMRLRAFPDGSFILGHTDSLVRYKVGEEPTIVASQWRSLGFDGRSIDDFWFWAPGVPEALTGLSLGVNGLCHVLDGTVIECIETADILEGELALGADGAVYLAAFNGRLVRYFEGSFEEIAPEPYGFYQFFRSGDALVFTTHGGGAFEVRGLDLTSLPTTAFVRHFVGTPEDFFYVTTDREMVKRDGTCIGGFSNSCSRITLWRENVIWHFDHGTTTEVGHELCLHDDPATCGPEIDALGFDEGELVILGPTVRRLGG